jgi:excisionase family DNA binding protein
MKTTAEAAAILGVSRRRVRQLIEHGRLKARRFGRDWLIDDAAITAYRPRPEGRPGHLPKTGD